VRVADHGGGCFEVGIEEDTLSLVILSRNDNRARVTIDGSFFEVGFAADADTITLFIEGETTSFKCYSSEAQTDDVTGGDSIAAPMPGLVKLVNFKVGGQVAEGDVLIVLEAMKMEYALKAPRDGTIAEVLVAAGDQVENGALLLLLHSDESDLG